MSFTTERENEIVELRRELDDLKKSLREAVQNNQVLSAGVEMMSHPQ